MNISVFFISVVRVPILNDTINKWKQKILINKVIDFAKAYGCHKLRWQVSNWNTPAISFYKGLGAVIDAQERNYNLDL